MERRTTHREETAAPPSEVPIARSFDPILDETPGAQRQYTLFPVKYPKLFAAYKEAVACFWTADELDLGRDRADFESMGEGEQHLLLLILGFFAASDGIVNSNLHTNFAAEVIPQEIQCFYSMQALIEAVHAESYSLLIDTLVRDRKEKDRVFSALTTMPAVAVKARFMLDHMNRDAPFEERLVAFAAAEGLLFSACFATIFFYRQRNLMPGLAFANQLISRDEGMHCKFAVLLHSHLQNKASPALITRIIGEATEVEMAFVRESLPRPILGMNADVMCTYVKYVADKLLSDFGCVGLYGATNPFEFMTLQSLRPTANFFEVRVSEYSLADVGQSEEDKVAFSEDAEF